MGILDGVINVFKLHGDDDYDDEYDDYDEMLQALQNHEIDMIFYVGRNPDLIYSRFPANRIQYAGKCHGIFRLCNAGTVLPQGKWIFLCKYYVYR